MSTVKSLYSFHIYIENALLRPDCDCFGEIFTIHRAHRVIVSFSFFEVSSLLSCKAGERLNKCRTWILLEMLIRFILVLCRFRASWYQRRTISSVFSVLATCQQALSHYSPFSLFDGKPCAFPLSVQLVSMGCNKTAYTEPSRATRPALPWARKRFGLKSAESAVF